MSYYMNKCNYTDWENQIRDDDSLLIVSSTAHDPILYLYKPVTVSHYSTICTPTYDETLLAYWNSFPEKTPTVIAVECWYDDMHVSDDSWIMEWCNSHYELAYKGTYWWFYRPQKND